MKYLRFSAPCLDKYPLDQNFITNTSLLKMAQRRIQASSKLSSINQELSKLKSAFIVRSLWNPKVFPVLKIAFLDGNDHQKEWVRQVIDKNLAPLISKIRLEWNAPVEESHIRISFGIPNQAWSMIGSDALQVPKNQPTMNLGWLDDDIQYDVPELKGTGMVVLHEFGHAMGMIHEHQNPKGNPIVWNKPVVYEELARTNGWNKQLVDRNVFQKYGDYELCQQAKEEEDIIKRKLEIQNYCQGELVNGSEYDPESVMHYFFPARWIKEGPKKLLVNETFSKTDKKWLRKYYGVPEPKPEVEVDEIDPLPYEPQVDIDFEIEVNKKLDEDESYARFLIYSILALIVFLIVLYIIYDLVRNDEPVPLQPF